MRVSVFAACAAAAFYVVNPSQVFADQSGFANLHDHSIVKGRLCFTAHTHVGTGAPKRSKRLALTSAVESWSSFTDFEYGSDWAGWRIAAGKKVMCEPGGGAWSCEVHARPCLTGGRGSRQARR